MVIDQIKQKLTKTKISNTHKKKSKILYRESPKKKVQDLTNNSLRYNHKKIKSNINVLFPTIIAGKLLVINKNIEFPIFLLNNILQPKNSEIVHII